MRTLEKQPDPAPSAEQRFRDAFERLRLSVPMVLPKGTPVSQNNVAKEAGCDPSALRKTRFPLLVLAIQEWVESYKIDQQPSGRQLLLKKRRKNRDTRETIADLKKQRDEVAALLVDADLRIVELSEKVADLQASLDRLQPSARVLDLTVAGSPESRLSARARLILIRGLPGSGKTTKARTYQAAGYEHFEADAFFMTEGQYLFDEARLADAHAWCFKQTREALAKGCKVVVANVFATVNDIKPYVTLCDDYEIVEAKGKGRSVHYVPEYALSAMRAAWVSTAKLSEALQNGGKGNGHQ